MHAERDSDIIYCTGDLVDVGFYPQEVVDCVRATGVICVQGNHDRNVIARYEEGVAADARPKDFVDLNAQRLDDQAIAYLKQLPRRIDFAHDGVSYLLEHLYRGYDLIQTQVEYDAFWADTPVHPGTDKRAILLGHTHNPGMYYVRDNTCWLNPGSIGYNRPGDPSIATRYMVIQDGKPSIRELDHPHCQSRLDIGAEFERQFGMA